ncbi:MAG: hypothetical protein KBC41_02215 [Candidatus Pacebacteria bacterium]|nr:hypothetical protein [Candidatus Paceibacterota bacterium]MBP9866869.1 hypothetical protein [Candidatus Paceibacterota bacterium]
MAKRVIEHTFTGTTTPYSVYDSTKTVLGDLINQYTGIPESDKYAGPLKIGVARPNETSTAVPGVSPHVTRWAAKNGFYSTGTVAVSGTVVTGSGTSWLSAGVPIGARIGFGSTNPALITNWYQIATIPSATGITLQSSAGTISAGTSFVIDMKYQIDLVFLTDNAAAAATRRVTLFKYDRNNSSFTWVGFITSTYPVATLHTTRGFRAVYKTYTNGTVAVSGATVTGTTTTWLADRIFIGSRIGFGSTDPTQISTWYYINAISSETSVTIQNNVTASGTGGVAANLTISAGATYVIEEIIILQTNTNATATNGGLFMTAGLSVDDFTSAGTTIAAATTVDKAKASYWLADAAVVTNTVPDGLAIDDFDTGIQQFCYVIDSTANPKVYKYNFRKALTLASGKDTTTRVLVTGTQAVTGTVSQNNNGRVGILNHGPGSGVKCLYFATTSRIYRAQISGITNGSTTWASDSMVEVPTGGTTTYAVTNAMTSVEIADQIDRLIIMSTGAGGVRSYITKYNTISNPFDHIFLVDSKQIDQSSSDSSSIQHVGIQASVLSVWSEAGLLYFARNGTTSAVNQLYVVPVGADWEYADGTVKQRLYTPSLSTVNATKLVRVYVNGAHYLGTGSLTLPTEPYRVYYRTAGIVDNSGSWSLVDQTGNLSSATAGSSIQFAIEFRMIGTFCLPGRVFNICCVYEDNTTDSHYQPSVAASSTTNKQFAWRFSTVFGGTVPTLRVRLYDAVSGGLLVDDTTVASTGIWEKSTNDGSTWSPYDTLDKINDTTYIRYTPASLGDGVKVRALLTQN